MSKILFLLLAVGFHKRKMDVFQLFFFQTVLVISVVFFLIYLFHEGSYYQGDL